MTLQLFSLKYNRRVLTPLAFLALFIHLNAILASLASPPPQSPLPHAPHAYFLVPYPRCSPRLMATALVSLNLLWYFDGTVILTFSRGKLFHVPRFWKPTRIGISGGGGAAYAVLRKLVHPPSTSPLCVRHTNHSLVSPTRACARYGAFLTVLSGYLCRVPRSASRACTRGIRGSRWCLLKTRVCRVAEWPF